jgi:hypothetical protein
LDNVGLEPLDDIDAAAGGFDYDDELYHGIIYQQPLVLAWPPRLDIPAFVEDLPNIPRGFICPISRVRGP